MTELLTVWAHLGCVVVAAVALGEGIGAVVEYIDYERGRIGWFVVSPIARCAWRRLHARQAVVDFRGDTCVCGCGARLPRLVLERRERGGCLSLHAWA